ncbi:MAG: hypothetical protein PWQ14_887 [Rikenellaceae bacterium]|nr:hypothetical protein [Rikenellaceae bacterium]
MIDFTLLTFKNLLESLQVHNYQFFTVEEYFTGSIASSTNRPLAGFPSPHPFIILRHDVDRKPKNSLATAIIENKLGIQGTYYFRLDSKSFNVDIIKQIADLGHEVGYHYETMDTINEKFKMNNLKFKSEEERIDEAYKLFCENLEQLRKLYPVKTICMHGSPRSAFDNRDIWKKYSYKDLGIVGEPYFDIDFDRFFYLTDTGRRWDGFRYSIRDKVPQQERWIKEGLIFKTTNDIIKAAQENKLPTQIMITVHPQRWTNHVGNWMKEYCLQSCKNVVKRFLIDYRKQ